METARHKVVLDGRIDLQTTDGQDLRKVRRERKKRVEEPEGRANLDDLSTAHSAKALRPPDICNRRSFETFE
jgi:hypothetical protein